MQVNELLIGADPELFVRKGRGLNPVFISGHTFPCGDKLTPRPVPYGGAVQVDGLALELNIPPSVSAEDFKVNIGRTMAALDSIVKETDPECDIIAVPTVLFGTEYLNSLPENVRILGCNPDWNAYTMEENQPPDCDQPFRTGAGHIHLGWCKDVDPFNGAHMYECAQMAKQLDFFLGMPSLFWDRDGKRRELYGKAGAFRPKSYGMEYRVLSNQWLNSIRLVEFVYSQSTKAFTHYHRGNKLVDKYNDVARTVVNRNVVSWPQSWPELKKVIYDDIEGTHAKAH